GRHAARAPRRVGAGRRDGAGDADARRARRLRAVPRACARARLRRDGGPAGPDRGRVVPAGGAARAGGRIEDGEAVAPSPIVALTGAPTLDPLSVALPAALPLGSTLA